MITIRSLIAGLMATLLAVISLATFLLVYFASLDSVESLTTLSVETASDRIAGEISTTLLDRVTNPLVAVARAARVRDFTAPADDEFASNSTSPDRFAWHGEWRTLFDDIVSGCPACLMSMRFIDGSYGSSFPVPNQNYRYHQFTRSYNGTSPNGAEDFFDHVTYKLTLQTFDEAVVTGVTEFKPSTATRVGSTFWTSVKGLIAQENLALPSRFPGVWTGADIIPKITIFPSSATDPPKVALRADVVIANTTMDIALITVYIPLTDVMRSAEASLPTPNSRVFAINEIGVVTEVGQHDKIIARVQASKCGDPATAGCYPRISDINFAPLTTATNNEDFFKKCPALNQASYPVPSDGSSSRAQRTSSKLDDDDGNIYFVSPRCVDTPFSLSKLRVVTIIPQNDINSDLSYGRNVSIAIVVVFFIVALVFGYLFVWYLLRPFEQIAHRMKKAALLADNDPKQDSSCLEEIARLQHAYETMNDELLRLKGFVPQSVLQLDPEDDEEFDLNNNNNRLGDDDEEMRGLGHQQQQPGGSAGKYLQGEDASSPQGRFGGAEGGTLAAMASAAGAASGNKKEGGGTTAAGGAASGTAAAVNMQSLTSEERAKKSTALFRRAHIMAERLSVSVSSINRQQVTVSVLNLRNFHGAIADMSTDALSRAVEQIVRLVSDVTAEYRGVVDFFHGDHYVLTYGAARSCQQPVPNAIMTCLKVTEALEADPLIQGMSRLGVPYASGSSSSSSMSGSSSSSSPSSSLDSSSASSPSDAKENSGKGGEDEDNNNEDDDEENNNENIESKSSKKKSGGKSSLASTGSNNSSSSPFEPARLILSAGVARGEATVGSFGSSELKRFCTIGPCYSQAFEIELLLKDSPQLRRSYNTLPHSIGVPHFMLEKVFREFTLEMITVGSISKIKTGIARVVTPVSAQAGLKRIQAGQQEFEAMHMLSTPRDGDNDTFSPKDKKSPKSGEVTSTRDCLEGFIDFCCFDPIRHHQLQQQQQQQNNASKKEGATPAAPLTAQRIYELQNAVAEKIVNRLKRVDPLGAERLVSIFAAANSAAQQAALNEQQQQAAAAAAQLQKQQQQQQQAAAAAASASAAASATTGGASSETTETKGEEEKQKEEEEEEEEKPTATSAASAAAGDAEEGKSSSSAAEGANNNEEQKEGEESSNAAEEKNATAGGGEDEKVEEEQGESNEEDAK